MPRWWIFVLMLSLTLASPLYADTGPGLIAAAAKGDTEKLELLLERGADIDARDKYGVTALMLASANGYTATTEFLLGKGARINLTADNGMTALMAAERGGRSDIVVLLKEAKEVHPASNEISIQNKILNYVSSGKWREYPVAMIIAAIIIITGQLLVVWLINYLKNKQNKAINIQTRDKNGRTALMAAAMNGYIDIVRILLAAGADVNVMSKDGKTALALAAYAGHTNILELLLNAKDPDVDVKDTANTVKTGATPPQSRKKVVELVK